METLVHIKQVIGYWSRILQKYHITFNHGHDEVSIGPTLGLVSYYYVPLT